MYFEHSIKTLLPIDIVYETLKNDLCKLVDYLPNVKKIEVLEKKKAKNKINILNKWYGKYQIPSFISRLLNINEIAWLDRAEWYTDEYLCNWRTEPLIFKKYVDIHGKNTYTSQGKYTIIKITGDINIDLTDHPLVPSLFSKKVNKEVSKITVALIKPNFTKLIKGLEEYINKKKSG